jgi:MFS family permease
MTPHSLMPLMVAPLMLLAIWRRVRGQFGRQPIRRKRMIARIAIFSVLGALAALGGLYNFRLLEGLFGGVLAGAALGLVGLRLTRFERGADGSDAYFPNPWIGGALTVLLVARLAWRLSVLAPLSTAAASPSQGMPAIGQSPLTLLVLGLMIGYYISYYAGLLIHHRRFERAQAAS